MAIQLPAFPFNTAGQMLAKLAQPKERRMQFLLVIGLAPILLLAMKVAIRNIEQELRRKPFRYDDID